MMTRLFLPPTPQRLADALWLLWDALFPPRCVGCQRVGYRLCPSCWRATPELPSRRCPRCAHPLSPSREQASCDQCRHPRWCLVRVEALYPYTGPWRQAIQALKYRRDRGLALLFARLAEARLRHLGWPISCIIPIPLDPRRRRERGYNQVDLWARRLAYQLAWPYRPHALQRVRATISQVGLSREARWVNVREAFQASPEVYGCRVLLVDDVLTTGATLNEAAQALLRAGAIAVYGFVLARTIWNQGGSRHEPVAQVAG